MIVEVDKKGRILLPKKIRDDLKLEERSKLKIMVEGDKIILIKEKSIADEYAGKYREKRKIPEDLDQFLNRVIEDWWRENT